MGESVHTIGSQAGILFVSHDASRAGAQMQLLHFLRWFKKNGKRPFSVLLPADGDLSGEFAEVTDTWAIERSSWCPGGRRATALRLLGFGGKAKRAEVSDIRQFASRCSPGLIYKNSISSAWADMLLPNIPVLTHVHEMGFAFNMQGQPGLKRLLSETKQFIACSAATRENLTGRWGVSPERVETIYESIPVEDLRAVRSRQEILDELKIPREAELVVGCGTADWRKGTDLFVQLARLVRRDRGDAHFVWVGARKQREVEEFEHDVRLAGLSDAVHMLRAVPRAADYIAAADVFALTSREDPYPLVCLEAAALGKPIVCFAGGGGMPEFVEEDCGFVVPYLDIAAMAERTIALLGHAECRGKMGEAARRKVTRRHDINVAGPRTLEVIERTMNRAAE